MLTTPHKRFKWAREERFPHYFGEFSFFHELLQRRRPESHAAVRELMRERAAKKRWKPAAWTPWLWMK